MLLARARHIIRVIVTGAALVLPFAQARADIGVEFKCTVPASSGFDCNMLKQRFFTEQALPFVKPTAEARNVVHTLQVSVSRLPVLNGFNYEIIVSESGSGSTVKTKTFLNDGTNPTSALQTINGTLQRGVLAFAAQVGEATTPNHQAVMTYRDPYGDGSLPAPVAPKSDGRWILQPNASAFLSKYSAVPLSLSMSGGTNFNYSGDHNRYTASATGYYNRQSVAVTTGSSQQLYGVDTHALNAAGAVVIGLDSQNHVNLGVGGTALTAPLSNLDVGATATVGVEYNPRPFLKADSNSFAVGCKVGPTYYDFAEPNILDQQQFLAISQGCSVAGSILLDQQRGTVISGQVGENWIVNAPSFVGVTASLSANLRVTDRLTFSPNATFTWQTKAITTASSKNQPSLDGLSPQEIADEEVKFAAQSASGSALGYTFNGTLSYTFGDGVNRSAQDQRGTTNH